MKTYREKFLAGLALGYASISSPLLCATTLTDCDEAGLRAAVANGGTVTFACDGTIAFTDTLTVVRDVSLQATGHQVTISGDNKVQVFSVRQGASLTLMDLTVADGWSTNGGGIYNEGYVSLINCRVTRHRAVNLGGGIYNCGTLTVSNSVLSENSVRGLEGSAGSNGVSASVVFDSFGRCHNTQPGTAGGPGGEGGSAHGGALFNGGSAQFLNSTLESNSAVGGPGGSGGSSGGEGCSNLGLSGGSASPGGEGAGGGIYNLGFLTLTGSTLAGNEAVGGDGGKGGLATTSISSPGAGGNGGQARGGGIWNLGTNDTRNSTIANNFARGGGGGQVGDRPLFPCWASGDGNGGAASGGGIFNQGDTSLLHVTIWNNQAVGGTGTNHTADCGFMIIPGTNGDATASDISASTGAVLLANSIVGSPGSTSSCFGVMIDNGNNLCGDTSAAFSAPGSLNNVDPRLGPLANNGGPTPTLALLFGSPAIDAGDDAHCPAVDQRGVTRPALSHCDIGAYELVPDFFYITSITQPTGATLRIRGMGVPSQSFQLQASPSFANWEEVVSGIVSPTGWFQVETTNGSQWRFYRTMAP